ncbi:tryptophan--tRNA ligase [Candidatus Bathyarchaeota archaeon ex4484_40]|nr:MAG: tryptophan--tRNA ligase [Candidatus Bathyarchaeota archaeon ex4484_40]
MYEAGRRFVLYTDWILDMYEAGRRFVLYTGRGPSGPVHIGHLIPWIFTKHLQDVFGAKLYFQMTDDEKFLINPEFTLEKSNRIAYENALDVIAVGFDPKKTFIIMDSERGGILYKIAVQVAKRITFSTVKAVFGLEESSNIGIIFFPAIQAVPCFIESVITGENTPCLIPAAIDQDPYWRVTRDVAPKLGYYKPAQIHCKFLPGLGKGGNPIYYYYYYLFEEEDSKIKELEEACRNGDILCGECKIRLAERIKRFLTEHQKRREEAKDHIEEYLFREP